MSKEMEIKALRRENKRLRKRIAKMSAKQSSFLSQSSWQKSLDIVIRFLQVAKSTEIQAIISRQGEINGSSNR